jgi:two-component system nitrogen regulation response regulator GlnG
VHTLLIMGKHPQTSVTLEKSLRSRAIAVTTVDTGEKGLERATRQPPDVVLLHDRLPDMSAHDVLEGLRATNPRLPVILLAGEEAAGPVLDGRKDPVPESLPLPLDGDRLRRAIRRALCPYPAPHAAALFEDADEAEPWPEPLLGHSPAMQRLYRAIRLVAPQETTVLLLGETGTGKELVARFLHQASPRRAAALVALNCAGVPEALLENELFGHEKGAFTGADRARPGRFEEADGGTLFLDEIGDMPLAAQGKLLRVLQDQRFERLGSNRTIRTNARILAATNKDLPRLVAAGTFREDLYHRLNVFSLRLPPLRERDGDLADLADHFCQVFNQKFRKDVREIEPAVLGVLYAYPWPGNVRELRSALEYAMLHADGAALTLECLPPELHGRPAAPLAAPPGHDDEVFNLTQRVRALLGTGERQLYRKLLHGVDQVVLQEVLRHTDGHMGRAGELLGLSPMTLRQKVRQLGLPVRRARALEETAANR